MKTPAPDHPITITPTVGEVSVKAGPDLIAFSDKALTLNEADSPPVQYLPRDAALPGHLVKNAITTVCPYKGVANYYDLIVDDRLIERACWSYESPYPAMTAIAGYLAFYPDKVTISRD